MHCTQALRWVWTKKSLASPTKFPAGVKVGMINITRVPSVSISASSHEIIPIHPSSVESESKFSLFGSIVNGCRSIFYDDSIILVLLLNYLNYLVGLRYVPYIYLE